MPQIKLASGNNRDVIFWAETQPELDGVFCQCPTVSLAETHKVLRITNYFTALGRFPDNREKFKSVEGDLHEIKSHQLRLIGFFYRASFVIVLCVRKKKDNLNPSDVTKAKRLMSLAKKELKNGIQG